VHRRAETSLYAAVKNFLEAQGFVVKGEVGHCDVVAVRGDEPARLVIAELKLGLSLELLLQAVDRMRVADEVWLAVPATRRGRDRDRRAHRLCRLLGVGLLAVDASRAGVEVLVEPAPYRPRTDQKARQRLLREHGRRRGDPTAGGQTRLPVMTAYRQRALDCAVAMRDGPRTLKSLRPFAPDAAGIMQRNVYGWFERQARGVYRLTPSGQAALPETPAFEELPYQQGGNADREVAGALDER
jgi:hypothetical protein